MTRTIVYERQPPAASAEGKKLTIVPYSNHLAQKAFARLKKKLQRGRLRDQAVFMFLNQETGIQWMYENEQLQRNQGLPSTFFIGEWKHAKRNGLHVAVSDFDIGLRSQGDVWYLQWAYCWRPDQPERGFIEFYDKQSLKEIKDVHAITENFTQTLEGYIKIAQARRTA